MRERATVLIIRDETVLMMWRNKQGRIYHTFIGGGIEGGETPAQAAISGSERRDEFGCGAAHKIVGQTE